MDKEGYIRILKAIAHLIIVVMVEAGRAPLMSAKRVASAFLQATVGKKLDEDDDKTKK